MPDVPIMGSKEYKKICENHSCIDGACLRMSQAYKKLGLDFIEGEKKLSWIRNNLPVEFGIFCHVGYHSILVIRVKRNKLLLANYAKDRLYWMEWKKFKKKIDRERPKSIMIKEAN